MLEADLDLGRLYCAVQGQVRAGWAWEKLGDDCRGDSIAFDDVAQSIRRANILA